MTQRDMLCLAGSPSGNKACCANCVTWREREKKKVWHRPSQPPLSQPVRTDLGSEDTSSSPEIDRQQLLCMRMLDILGEIKDCCAGCAAWGPRERVSPPNTVRPVGYYLQAIVWRDCSVTHQHHNQTTNLHSWGSEFRRHEMVKVSLNVSWNR